MANVYIWLSGLFVCMHVGFFTEGASTKSEDVESDIFRDYFAGTFASAKTLIDDIEQLESVSIDIHFLSEEFGYIRGDDSVSEWNGASEKVDDEAAIRDFEAQLQKSAQDVDVFVVLLSKEIFKQVVVPIWDELAEHANPDAIWCMSSSANALEEVDLDPLSPSVIVYNRSGVARIGNEAREALIEKIRNKQNDTECAGQTSFQEFGRTTSTYELALSVGRDNDEESSNSEGDNDDVERTPIWERA